MCRSLSRRARGALAPYVALSIGSVFGLLSGACTPKYQSLYDSDVRFEHCYRVDEERNVAIIDKLQCWQDWSHRYSYGQSRDRISYAEARVRTLAQALAAGEQAVPRGAVGEPQRALPQPMTAYAPPPLTMKPASATNDAVLGSATPAPTRESSVTEGGASADTASFAMSTTDARPPWVDAPGASCSGGCAKTWTSCKQQCKAGVCRTSCDEHYRGCMRGCF